MALPAPFERRIDEMDETVTVREYWIERARQHTLDNYAGVPLSKFPEDLRVYEHLMWDMEADVVVELGCQFGGSSMWLRDRLSAFARYRDGSRGYEPLVVSIDIEMSRARENLETLNRGDRITLLEGDIRDPELALRVRDLIPTGARVLVIEDSSHEYETTRAALENYADFAPVGGYVVIEDGSVDIEWMRVYDEWPRGVLPALDEWLESPLGAQFTVRRDLEIYGVTGHPRGFLQRISA